MSKLLFLVDGTLNIETITKINSSNIEIISLDIHSHHLLSDLEIEHKIIEDYLTSDENILLNHFSQKLATTWHQEKTLESVLDYNNFNLGKSIETPIHLYLLETSKLLVGIKNIIDDKKFSEIYLSTKILSLIDFISGVNLIEIKNTDQSYKESEKLPRPIFFGKNINLWIPREFALKCAKIIESIFSITFRLKFNSKKPRFDETILLLDLNPRPYETLLYELSKLENNITFLKDCGTVLWNKTNLDILRNTHSKIIGLNDFGTPTLTSKISKLQKIFLETFTNFMLEFEPKGFDICGINMWKSLRPGFLKICYKNFEDGILIFELTKVFLENINVKSILLLYNTNLIQQIFIHFSHTMNIPCFRLQHGLDPLNQYLANLQQIHVPKHQKIKHFVWSKLVKNYLIKHDVVKEKDVIPIGNPRYDGLFNTKKPNQTSEKILLTSSFTYTGFDLSGYDSKESLHHKKMFEKACRILNSIPNKKLIVKLHPGAKDPYDVQKIINKINPSIPVFKSQNVIKLLEDCDVLVNMGFSTTMLEAMILQIPTISIMTNSGWYSDDEIIVDGITKSVNTPEELEAAINSVLFDSVFRENLIQKGNNFVKKYLENSGTASKSLIKYLK